MVLVKTWNDILENLQQIDLKKRRYESCAGQRGFKKIRSYF